MKKLVLFLACILPLVGYAHHDNQMNGWKYKCDNGHTICGVCGKCYNNYCEYGFCGTVHPFNWVPVECAYPEDQEWVLVYIENGTQKYFTVARWLDCLNEWDFFFDLEDSMLVAGFDGSKNIAKSPLVTQWQYIDE